MCSTPPRPQRHPQPQRPAEPGLPFEPRHIDWMRAALQLAAGAGARGDVPVGSIVVDAVGTIIGTGANDRHSGIDPTAHAEILAIRAAAQRRGDRILTDCTLIVTLEPCVMCAGAIAAARIPTVVFGAWDEKAGAVGSMFDVLRDRRMPHRSDVIAGVLEQECAATLRKFFREQRGEPSPGIH